MIHELEKIQDTSEELDRSIKKILKMSQIQSTNLTLNKKSEDINQVIQQSIEACHYIAQKKKIRTQPELSPLFMIQLDAPLIR